MVLEKLSLLFSSEYKIAPLILLILLDLVDNKIDRRMKEKICYY